MAVTLKDIAEEMGLTATTVHRALYGKKGVSEETRKKVQQTAASMGYRPNYLASSLKRRQNLQFAIAMPDTMEDNRYYYGNLWAGVKSFFKEVEAYDVTPMEFTYPLLAGANGAVLKNIYENESNHICGVLTMAEENEQSMYFVERLAAKNIPVVFVGSDHASDHRFCCVRSYDEMAGSLAAELLTAFCPSDVPQKVILTGHYGHLGMKDQYYNSQGFLSFLRRNAPQVEVVQIQGGDSLQVRDQIKAALEKDPEVTAIYSCSARYTVRMVEAVTQLGLEKRLRLIGNDCFEESVDYLRRGILSGIIDKKTAKQSYTAMKTLFNYAVKAEYPPSSTIWVSPEIVLRSNVDMPGRLPE